MFHVWFSNFSFYKVGSEMRVIISFIATLLIKGAECYRSVSRKQTSWVLVPKRYPYAFWVKCADVKGTNE